MRTSIQRARSLVREAQEKYRLSISGLSHFIALRENIKHGTLYVFISKLMDEGLADSLSEKIIAKNIPYLRELLKSDMPALLEELESTLSYFENDKERFIFSIKKATRYSAGAKSERKLSENLNAILNGEYIGASQYNFWVRACRCIKFDIPYIKEL